MAAGFQSKGEDAAGKGTKGGIAEEWSARHRRGQIIGSGQGKASRHRGVEEGEKAARVVRIDEKPDEEGTLAACFLADRDRLTFETDASPRDFRRRKSGRLQKLEGGGREVPRSLTRVPREDEG